MSVKLKLASVSCTSGECLSLRGVRGRILVEIVEVQPDEELLKLAFLGQVADDLVHEAGALPELGRDVHQFLFGLTGSADVDSVAAHDEVQLEDELEDLVQRQLQALVPGAG